jgi:hypothetical protein
MQCWGSACCSQDDHRFKTVKNEAQDNHFPTVWGQGSGIISRALHSFTVLRSWSPAWLTAERGVDHAASASHHSLSACILYRHIKAAATASGWRGLVAPARSSAIGTLRYCALTSRQMASRLEQASFGRPASLIASRRAWENKAH